MNPFGLNVFVRLIQELLPWFYILLNITGIVIAATYLKRSRWILLVLGAFVVEGASAVASKIVVPLVLKTNDPSRISTFFALSSALTAMAKAALVVGLAGMLSDWDRSSRISPTPLP